MLRRLTIFLLFISIEPVFINLAGIPPIIEFFSMAEKSLLTRLLLVTIVLSGIIAPADILDVLQIQQLSPIIIGLPNGYTLRLFKSAISLVSR